MFNDAWFTNELYNSLTGEVKEHHRARCRLCVKEIDIGNMGEAARFSKLKGKTHLDLAQQQTFLSAPRLATFLNPSQCICLEKHRKQ